MAQTSTGTSASVQIAFHQRMAQLLHDHATWAALATVVVLLAKYLFNLPITQAEVLTFFGIMATYLFGASWVATAHINAMALLGGKQATSAESDAVKMALAQGVARLVDAQASRARAADSSPPPAQ